MPGIEIPEGAGELDLGTVVLIPGAAIEGRVVDTEGLPVTGAEVRTSAPRRSGLGLAALVSKAEEGPPEATSDADGRFTVADRVPASPRRLPRRRRQPGRRRRFPDHRRGQGEGHHGA